MSRYGVSMVHFIEVKFGGSFDMKLNVNRDLIHESVQTNKQNRLSTFTILNPNKTNNINSLNKVVLPRLHREKKGSTTSLSSGRPLLAQIDAQWGQKMRELY